MKTLWQIGTADGSMAEFALAPDGFLDFNKRFPLAPLFIVGRSDPRKDWPCLHPGPLDVWVGSREHTYTILFGLADAPREDDFRLVIDLVDSHLRIPPKLRIGVNGHQYNRQTPPGSANMLEERPPIGCRSQIVVAVPGPTLRTGLNTLTITTLSGCWLLYDRIALETSGTARLAAVEPETTILGGHSRQLSVRNTDDRPHQGVRILLRHTGESTEASVRVNRGAPTTFLLRPGNQQVDLTAPAVEEPQTVSATIEIAGHTVATGQIELTPVRDWVVYLLHHTHLDIGYTHVQSDVEAMQWNHLEQAIDLARRTDHYPPEARFKWNPEGLWAVDSYLQQAAPEKRKRLIDAVKNESIGLDALYANDLTALCRPEELFELIACARRFSRTHDLTIDSAMITDVPGYTWGLVPALAHSGVRYLSIGPNRGHRVGDTLLEWGDRPFYWVSPSGQERVLCWMAGKGYSWFHGPWRGAETYDYSDVKSNLDSAEILEYLGDLEAGTYPYDMVQLRYNIGSDNGPPDPDLADFVKDWNTRHLAPKLVITTTRHMMRALEDRYGDRIPSVRGDFTPYWEDGAASTARETAINRNTAERLVQAQTLWAMLAPESFPTPDFRDVWRDVVLYDEHTWGAWNSISDPDGEFTAQQWKVKQAFALDADRRSRELLARALQPLASQAKPITTAQVFNTSSWERTDLVVLPKDWILAGDLVKDTDHNPVPSQRLTTGELAFVAENVPPLGAATFTFHAGRAHTSTRVTASPTGLSNERLTVEVDITTGAITSLKCAGIPFDLVNRDAGLGLNDYFYVAGRKPDQPQRNDPVVITVKENGPLVASLLIESDAPGCHTLSRELRLIAGINRLDIINVLDKRKIYEPEGVHLAFPFNVPDGVMRMDIPWAMIRPQLDQLPGSCKNYFTIGRGVDISNREFGVTWATVDAPLVEVGAISADSVAVGWIRYLEPSTTLYSYVMNNYWETNYRAAQEGPARFRYSIAPHAAFDFAAAKRFGIERSQPLLVIPTSNAAAVRDSLFHVEPDRIIATSIKPSEDGDAWIVRLFNPTDRRQNARLIWSVPHPKVTWLSDPNEQQRSQLTGPVNLPPWGIVTLRCDRR